LGIPIEDLKTDFKQLHEKYSTTESSFIVDDLLSLTPEQKENLSKSSLGKKSILHEYNSNKKRNLKLYDGVLQTLKAMKAQGAIIVGFTESHAFYTKYRLKHLGLDGIFDYIYSPVDLPLPASFQKIYAAEFWEPKLTKFRYLAREVKKPNAEILEIILKDFGASKEHSIYIGDKLDRDVFMAQSANITSVWAKYGNMISNVNYQLLIDVTHWTPEDVLREQEFKAKYANNKPADIILEKSFSEILQHVNFFRFDNFHSTTLDLSSVIDIWKKVVDVQQHFNDLELRIRNYALTLITALVAGIALLEKDKTDLQVFGYDIPASALLGVVGILVLFAFYYMDKFWYHKLLKGAVKQGAFIENRYRNELPELGLTNSIGASSPHNLPWSKRQVHSDEKYRVFYLPLFLGLSLITFILFFRKPNPIATVPIKTSIDTPYLKVILPASQSIPANAGLKRDTIRIKR
jgi:FMN phosphatase YigB (HAD superfamily)